MAKQLLEPITLRLPKDDLDWLDAKAEENMWTRAQALRFCIRAARELDLTIEDLKTSAEAK